MNCKLYPDPDAQLRATIELAEHRRPEAAPLETAWLWAQASWLFWAAVNLVCVLAGGCK